MLSPHYLDILVTSKDEELSYQQKAVTELINESLNFIPTTRLKEDKRILLKGITGSGKTLVAGVYVDSLFFNVEEMVVIWVSAKPKLIQQSKKSLERLGLNTLTAEESLLLDELPNHSCTFLNWEKIVSKNRDLLLMRDTESKQSFYSVVQNTLTAGKKIVLIIDESHRNTNTQLSRSVISQISPSLIVELTATPSQQHYDAVIEMDTQSVINAGVIKKGIRVNFEEFQGTNLREYVLTSSLQRMLDLEKGISEVSSQSGYSSYQPLLLVQLPNNNEAELESTLAFFSERGYSEFGGNLAVYLSDYYTDELDAISNNQEIKVLLFKQAISEGWDCPRASVLTFLRDPNSTTFTLQTIGRTMRMVDRRHYPASHDFLNYSYIYAESDKKEILHQIQEQQSEQILLSIPLKEEIYNRPSLTLSQLKSHVWAGIEPVKILDILAKLKELPWIELLNRNPNVELELISGEYSTSQLEQGKMKTNKVKIPYQEISMEELNYLHISKWKKANLDFTLRKMIMDALGDISLKEKYLILSDDENIQTLSHHCYLAKEELEKERNPHVEVLDWSIPETIHSSNRMIHLEENTHYAYQELYVEENELEKDFSDFIEQQESVITWLKNPSSGSAGFRIAYSLNDRFQHFYPDFLIETDNAVYILDTKGNLLLDKKETHVKQSALSHYVLSIELDKEVVGGIVQKRNGQFYLYTGEELETDYDNLEKWQRISNFR